VGRRTKKVAGKAGSRARSASSGAAERVQDAAAQVDLEAVKQAAGAQVRSIGQAADAAAGTTRKAAQQAGTRGRAAAATGGMAAEAAVRGKEAVSDVDLAPLGEQLRGLAGLVSLTPRTTQRASALLPGRVAGIELDEEQLTVRLTAVYGTRLPQLAVQVHEAARPYAGQRRTLVEVVALEQPDDPTAPAGAAEAPERQRASTGGTGTAGSATDVPALPAPAPRRDDGEPVHDDAALAVHARPSARGRGRQKAPVRAKSDRPDASAPGSDPRTPDLPHPDLPHPDLPHPDLPGGTP